MGAEEVVGVACFEQGGIVGAGETDGVERRGVCGDAVGGDDPLLTTAGRVAGRSLDGCCGTEFEIEAAVARTVTTVRPSQALR